MKLLVDENIPPSVTEFLRKRDHDVKAVRDFAMGVDDESLVKFPVDEDRVLLTQDLWVISIIFPKESFSKREELGIIVIRPRVQTVENLKGILKKFLPDIEKREVNKALFIVEESGYRIRK